MFQNLLNEEKKELWNKTEEKILSKTLQSKKKDNNKKESNNENNEEKKINDDAIPIKKLELSFLPIGAFVTKVIPRNKPLSGCTLSPTSDRIRLTSPLVAFFINMKKDDFVFKIDTQA